MNGQECENEPCLQQMYLLQYMLELLAVLERNMPPWLGSFSPLKRMRLKAGNSFTWVL